LAPSLRSGIVSMIGYLLMKGARRHGLGLALGAVAFPSSSALIEAPA
jgi:hypothetical protein